VTDVGVGSDDWFGLLIVRSMLDGIKPTSATKLKDAEE